MKSASSFRLFPLFIVLFMLFGCGGSTSTDSSDGSSVVDPRLGTGYPNQTNFSVDADVLNPEAWSAFAVEVNITVNAADQANKPAAAGQVVSFLTEGGSIPRSCETNSSGSCTTVWQSGGPRPSNGRSTLLAFVSGEEAFNDVNGDGVFNSGDQFYRDSDVGEPYVDANENGRYDNGERFVDMNGDGKRNPPNGIFNGVLCSEEAEIQGSCSPRLVQVQNDVVIVMSGSGLNIDISPSPVDIRGKEIVQVTISIADDRNQPPPAGTVVVVESTNGALSGETALEVESTNWPGPITLAVVVGATPTDGITSGIMTVTATTPSGTVSTATAPVYDDPSAEGTATPTPDPSPTPE